MPAEVVMYSIEKTAFDEAVDYAGKKKGYGFSNDLLESLIYKIYDKKERMEFQEALRYSLNELYLHEEKRSIYRCAAGKYFSIMSARTRSARAQTKTPKKKKRSGAKKSTVGKVILERKGQYAFTI